MSHWTRRELVRDALLAAGLITLPTRAFGGEATAAANGSSEARIPWRNWAGDYRCTPRLRAGPADEQGVARLLRESTGVVRPVGAGHSFSPLVPCDGTLIACDQMSGVIDVDPANLQAEIWAGTRLHEIGPALDPLGQALINQPDIDDQALGGAIATSTHGTGRDLGSLSSYVVGLTLATPNGELIECDAEQNAEIFHAARCSIGSLGVVTRVRLQNRAPYRLNESTRLLPISELLAEAEELRDAHRHMELMALPHSGLGLLVVTNEETGDVVDVREDPSAVNGLREAWGAVGESPTIYRQALLQVLGTEADHRMGPSHRVLAHDRYVRFREMEYTLPAEAGPACLSEILETIEREEIPVVFPIEYRYVAADDVWLSMFNDRAGCSISMHQYADEDARPIFDAIEPIFWRYGGRPHWGKLHSLGADRLAELYPHWQDFTAVRNRLDPKGKMLNEHLRSVFGVASA